MKTYKTKGEAPALKSLISGAVSTAFISAALFTAAALLLLSGCSTVFTASITGTTIDKESWEEDEQEVAIGDVEVFLYNNEKDWTEDYTRWTEEDIRPDEVEEGEEPGYFLSTVTGEDGVFTFNGIIWNRLFPSYGKSGDRVEVYFLFFNRDYGVSRNTTPVFIVSDVTNRLTPFRLERITYSATIEGEVLNKNTGEGVGAVNLDVYVADSLDPLTYPEEPDYQLATAVDGTYTVQISFPKELGESVRCKITAERNGFNCEDYDDDGTPADDFLSAGPIEKDTTYTAEDIEIKQTEFSETLEGRVFNDNDGDDDVYTEGTADSYVNGVTIWLFHEDPAGLGNNDAPDKRTVTRAVVLNDTTVEDGHFAFTGIEWEDEDYTEDYSTKVVSLYRPTPTEISDDNLDPPINSDDIDQYTMRSNSDNYLEIAND